MKLLSPFLLTVVVITALYGCSQRQERPSGLIKEDDYINLLAEFQLLKTYQQTVTTDSVVIDSMRNEILDKYHITMQQFDDSHAYYQQQIKQQQQRISKAIERLRMDAVEEKDSTKNIEDVR